MLPTDRGRGGIGRELASRVLQEIGDLYMVDLVCDTDLVPCSIASRSRPPSQ
jgi:hypothetical protein